MFANSLYTRDSVFHSDSKHFFLFQLCFLCFCVEPQKRENRTRKSFQKKWLRATEDERESWFFWATADEMLSVHFQSLKRYHSTPFSSLGVWEFCRFLLWIFTQRHSSTVPAGESWLRPVRTRMEIRPMKSLQRQNYTANICCYHLILYLGLSCFFFFFLSECVLLCFFPTRIFLMATFHCWNASSCLGGREEIRLAISMTILL